MIKVLDCEDQESTANSLSGLFGCSTADLFDQLINFDLERIYEEDDPHCPADEFLFKKLTSILGPPDKPEGICWFHLTRTFPENNFSEGILPLGMAIDTIWKTILRIFEETQHFLSLQSMRQNGVKNYHYQLKVPDPLHWGPFAMLVKESAFHAHEIGNHDYLELPEIIEDICNAYLNKSGLSIHAEVGKILVPCVVKFRREAENGLRGIGPAIYYYYKSIRKESFSRNANTCFDAGGKIIPRENILKIEYQDEHLTS